MSEERTTVDDPDKDFICNYDWTCYRPKGSCKDCTHAERKLMSEDTQQNEISASAPYDESGFKDMVLTEEGTKRFIELLEKHGYAVKTKGSDSNGTGH